MSVKYKNNKQLTYSQTQGWCKRRGLFFIIEVLFSSFIKSASIPQTKTRLIALHSQKAQIRVGLWKTVLKCKAEDISLSVARDSVNALSFSAAA